MPPNGIFYPCARWGWGWPDLGVLPPAPSRPIFGDTEDVDTEDVDTEDVDTEDVDT